MCPHLLEAGLSQPFALLHRDNNSAYICTSCYADRVESLLRSGVNTFGVAQASIFNRCEHSDRNENCWPCTTACVAALTIRWATAFRSDKHHANRIKRVIRHLNKAHDPASLNYCGHEPAPQRRLTAEQMAEQRRERMARERIQKRRDRFGLPPKPAVASKPPASVVVVRKAAVTA